MEIKQLTDEVLGEYMSLVATYFRLHQQPELSFSEFRTAEHIAALLRSSQIEARSIATTGVLAKIEGTAEGDHRRAIVLRADIDALPIEEQSLSPYPSQNKGVMHACGHDMHATILLGTLQLLQRHRSDFSATIFGLFQPAEELNPGGAKGVLAEGPFEGYDVVAVVGEHVEPTLPTGKVGICRGTYMAACDELHLSVRGRGGHAALREKIVDPILPAAELIRQLYQLPSLSPSPDLPTILSIGRIEANGATNVVPNQVFLQGTMRTFEEGWRTELKGHIDRLCRQIEHQYGVSIDNNFGEGYPSVYNSPAIADSVAAMLRSTLGDDAVVELGLRPTGEDFGYYTERYPSLFYRLGVGYEGDDFANGRAGALHTPQFCPDTRAIGHGVSTLYQIAVHLMGH